MPMYIFRISVHRKCAQNMLFQCAFCDRIELESQGVQLHLMCDLFRALLFLMSELSDRGVDPFFGLHSPFLNIRITYNIHERAKRASAQIHVFSLLKNVQLSQVIISQYTLFFG